MAGQKISQGNIFGRIGQHFGNSLAEQFPKEMERGRLAQGLENLSQPGSQLTPIQQYSHLLRSGANAEQIQQILPMLERINARQESTDLIQEGNKNAPGKTLAPTTQPNVPNQQPPTETPNRIIKPRHEQEALNLVKPYTSEERRERATYLNQNFPNRFPTIAAAESEADRERADEIAAQNTILQEGANARGTRQNLEQEVQKRLNFDLGEKHTNPEAAPLPTNYIKKQIDKADEEVANAKKTVQQAADDASEDMKKYRESRLKLITSGNKWWLQKSSKDITRQLDNLREEYAKRGELENFVNDMVYYHNLSRPYASTYAYPLKDNKELSSYVSKNLEPKNISKIGFKTRENNLDKFVQDLPKLIKDDDSLLAIASGLKDYSYDPSEFLSKVKELSDERTLRLNDRQRDELTADIGKPSIGDLLLRSARKPFGGK
jgi:hypothetical protein